MFHRSREINWIKEHFQASSLDNSITKAYKAFQPQIGNIVISRDVHFVENEKWNWEDTEQSNRDWKNDMGR